MKRFRLIMLPIAIAILALLLLVFIQQVEIGRLRQVIDKFVKEKDELTAIIRELKDNLERHGR